VHIRELDTSDPSARRTWHAVQERAVRADRPHALLEAFEAFEVVATEPSRWTARTWLEAVEGEAVVGVASLELPLAENLDVAEAEVSVLPEHRRRGIARALWEAVRERALAAGRSRVGAELTLDPGESQAGRAFADSVGAVDKHREDHLVADLPRHVNLVHTWTAPTNTAMHRTNTAMGFRVVEHMYEVETTIA
jgi:GNAT superfamily N-acetyltransferase